MIKLNGKRITVKQFPNGESLFEKSEIHNHIKFHSVIEWYYESNAEMFELMIIKSEIDDSFNSNVDLVIKYMPYSRMDRDNENYVFTLKHMAKFINSLGFNGITVIEAHSDVTLALLNKVSGETYTVQHVVQIMNSLNLTNEDVVLFFPDAGAQKRYGSMFSIENLVGFKQRDFKTGEIKDLQIMGKADTSKTVIIVDDLCSKGGTFMQSSKKLTDMGFSDIYLYTTHCENTIYQGDIFKTDYIKHVYTTDSIFKLDEKQSTDKITVFKI